MGWFFFLKFPIESMYLLDELCCILVPKGAFSELGAQWLRKAQRGDTNTDQLPQIFMEMVLFVKRQGKHALADGALRRVAGPAARVPTYCSKDVLFIHQPSELLGAVQELLNDIYCTENLPPDLSSLLPPGKFFLHVEQDRIRLQDYFRNHPAENSSMVQKLDQCRYSERFYEAQLRNRWALSISTFLSKNFKDCKEWPLEHLNIDTPELVAMDFSNIYNWWKSRSLYEMQNALCLIQRLKACSRDHHKDKRTTNERKKESYISWLLRNNPSVVKSCVKDASSNNDADELVGSLLRKHRKRDDARLLENLARLRDRYNGDNPEMHSLMKDIISTYTTFAPRTLRADARRWEDHITADPLLPPPPVTF